jgi:hypothetical protein
MIDMKNAVRLALEAPVDGDRAEQDAAIVQRWKEALPGVPLYRASVDGALLLFRPAPEEVAEALFNEPAGARSPKAVQQDMVAACLLYPIMNDLAGMAQHRPLLMGKLFIQCMGICGFGEDQDFKRVDR